MRSVVTDDTSAYLQAGDADVGLCLGEARPFPLIAKGARSELNGESSCRLHAGCEIYATRANEHEWTSNELLNLRAVAVPTTERANGRGRVAPDEDLSVRQPLEHPPERVAPTIRKQRVRFGHHGSGRRAILRPDRSNPPID
jgi:hypothetical protein